MIYHLFNANVYHHVPHMVDEILKHACDTNALGVEEHFFLLRLTDNPRLVEFNQDVYKNLFKRYNTANFQFIKKNTSLIKKIYSLKRNDNLIIHDKQILFGRIQLFWLLLWFLGSNNRSRISIIFWGVDEKKKLSKNLCYFILYSIQSKVLRSFKYVIALTADDKQKLMKWYHLSNVLVIGYIRDYYNEFKNIIRSPKKLQNPYRIMVSHSSFGHNKHLEILDLLDRFKDENIQIICPLSYGDSGYRKIVTDKGIQIFGDKFIYYDKLLSREEYNNLLASVDIFISNAVIQTGLYVINFCICTGKKIYLRDNNYNWMSHLGFKINNISELAEITYDDFIKPLGSEWLLNNDYLASQIYSSKSQINDWRFVYGEKNNRQLKM